MPTTLTAAQNTLLLLDNDGDGASPIVAPAPSVWFIDNSVGGGPGAARDGQQSLRTDPHAGAIRSAGKARVSFCDSPHSCDANGVLNYSVEIQGLWHRQKTLDQHEDEPLPRTFR